MTPLAVGATIGVLGGGQLARMMALEARRMGYRVVTLDPHPDSPGAQVADGHVVGALDDLQAAEKLAAVSDVITLDTEHVPAAILEQLEAKCEVRPGASVLGIIQDRLSQRRFLEREGVSQVAFAPVDDLETLRAGLARVGLPAVLKTRRSGYDGKGQARIDRPEQAAEAWQRIGEAPAVLEAFVDFECEASVLLARGHDGAIASYAVPENLHRNHVLWASRAPGRVPAALCAQAEALGARIAGALGHLGMLAVELFVTRAGGLLVNELAPRTHNSGHYTFGACATSQFEQHVRAVCGLPLGDPRLLSPAVMLNLLGDLWADGEPDWNAVWKEPGASLHLYGKADAKPGRKMGHVLVVDSDVEAAHARVSRIATALGMD